MLLACAPSQAELLAEALSAPDHASAVAACGRLPVRAGDPCRVQAAERFAVLDADGCAAVTTEPWISECRFQYAERLAGTGRAAEAFALCTGTRFSRECGYHLLREVARGMLDQDAPAAAAALEPWRAVAELPDAPRLFWKAWFREGRRADRRVDPTGCPDAVCTAAAREGYFESLRALHRADRAGFCAAPPSEVPGWAVTAETEAWRVRWAADACARDGAPPPAASPPPGAPAIRAPE